MQIPSLSPSWPGPVAHRTKAQQELPVSTSAGQNQPTTQADPEKFSSSAVPTGVQFNTQLLVALLNVQEGQYHAPPTTGPATKLSVPPPSEGQQTFSPVLSSAGALNVSALKGTKAGDLADGLVKTFGSNGSLDFADVEQALGLTTSTLSPEALKNMEKTISQNWKAAAGGRDSMTAAQLSDVIGKSLIG